MTGMTTMETVLMSLGRIEGQLSGLHADVVAERARITLALDDHEKRIKMTEKHVWKIGGVLACAAVAFEITVRFLLP